MDLKPTGRICNGKDIRQIQRHFPPFRPNMVYPDGLPYFKTYYDAIWDLYVLVTTANNPDVM